MTKMSIVAFAAGIMLLFSFTVTLHAQTEGWNIPANFKSMKNPVASNSQSIADGKELYDKHCKSCHGKTGLGDGPKAAALSVSCGDFTSKAFKSSTDGEIFYQVSEGKGKMPAFKKNIPDEKARWALVNYMRSLGAK